MKTKTLLLNLKRPLVVLVFWAFCLTSSQLTTGCAADGSVATLSQITATASKIGGDIVSYAQTLGTMLQTLNEGIQLSAPTIQQVAASWGLLPANSKQLAVFNSVVTNAQKVSTSVTALNKLLSPASLQNIATTTPVAPTALYLMPIQTKAIAIRPPHGEKDPFHVLLAKK